MLVDSLLQFIGEDPGQFSQSVDKWLRLLTWATLILIPLYLLFLLVAPFLFMKWKKKRFSFKNIVLGLIASIALVVFGLFSLVAAFYLLQGAAYCGLHGGC